MADIAQLLSQDYVTYAISTLNRALPSVVDGMKISQRRIIQTGLDNRYDQLVKVNRWSGLCMGTLHPHGDPAGVITHLADLSSYRYPLVDGHGNYGGFSWETGQRISADGPAASRYIEAKTTLLATMLLDDIPKQLLQTKLSYDGKQDEVCQYVPAFPLLPILGAQGIGTGYAVNVAPFNLKEIGNAIIKHLQTKKAINCKNIVPDWTSGCQTIKDDGLASYIASGRGTMRLQGKWSINKQSITITELPFCDAETYCRKVSKAIKDGKIGGIKDIQDLSHSGIEIRVVLHKGSDAENVVSQLLAHTPLEDTFSGNNTVLVDNMPKQIGLAEMLSLWLEARKSALIAKFKLDRDKANKRFHVIEGLLKAISSIDILLGMVKESKNRAIFIAKMVHYGFSPTQAESIADMPLHKLCNASESQLKSELVQLDADIAMLDRLIADDNMLCEYIAKQLKELGKLFSKTRLTKVADSLAKKAIKINKPKAKTPLQRMKEQSNALSKPLTRKNIKDFLATKSEKYPGLTMQQAWKRRIDAHIAYWNKRGHNMVPPPELGDLDSIGYTKVELKQMMARLNKWARQNKYKTFTLRSLTQALLKYGNEQSVRKMHADYWRSR